MSADISKLREIVGSHLANWRATTPLEDFANVDDVYRTLMPELEEFFATHTKQAQLDLLDELEKEAKQYLKACRHTKTTDAHAYVPPIPKR